MFQFSGSDDRRSRAAGGAGKEGAQAGPRTNMLYQLLFDYNLRIKTEVRGLSNSRFFEKSTKR